MLDFFSRLFDTAGFPTRWQCGSAWTPAHGWLHILSDLGVWSAYLAIPCVLTYFTLRRRDLPFRGLVLLFVAFILACGTAHLFEALMFWWPAYRLAGLIKLLTALVSWATVLALVPIVPQALALRSPAALQHELDALKIAEGALSASEERIRQLVENVKDCAIFMLDPHGHVLVWNAGAERVLGYRAQDIVAQSFALFFPSEDVQQGQPERALGSAAQHGKHEEEAWRLRQGGARFWASVLLTPLHDAAGQLSGYSIVIQDRSEHKQAEDTTRRLREEAAERSAAAAERARALALSEDRLRQQTRLMEAILHNMAEGVIVSDAAGRFVLFNPAAERMLGAGMLDVAPAEWSQSYGVYHPTTHQLWPPEQLPLARALRGELAEEEEILIRNDKLQADLHISTIARPLTMTDGTLHGGLVVFRDITAKKQSEAALRESEERFRNAFDHAPSGMFLTGLEGQWLQVNEALCRIVGRTEAELRATTWKAITHPDDLAPDIALAEQLRSGAIPYYHMEKRYIHKDGHAVWILLGGSMVRDARGQPAYFVGHVLDISERKRAEALVLASLEEKQVLLREIHHRVKNNLQVISSLLQLQSQHCQDARTVALFKESQLRVRAMALVHEQLYQATALASIDIATYIKSLVQHLWRSYRVSAGTVQLQLRLEPVRLSIDEAVPCGLLLNELLTNALKHAFPEGRSGTVSVALTQLAGEIRLEVADDGVSIPSQVTPQTSATFGLRLVAALVDQLHGKLHIQRDQGTVIRITFPESRQPNRAST